MNLTRDSRRPSTFTSASDQRFLTHCATVLSCLSLFSATLHAAKPKELHVSPKGNDAHEGSAERPLATLERARDLLRPLRNDAAFPGAVVHVHAGTYVRAQPFALGKQDSGRKNAEIVYRAQGTVSLIGGKIIPHNAFRPVSDPAVKARLPLAARDQVRELYLPSLGIKHCERFPESFTNSGGIIELFIDGARLPLARWPNEGYTTIERVLDSGKWQGPERSGGTFVYRGDRPAAWPAAVSDGLWIKGFWRVPWQPETVRVATLNPAAKSITLSQAVTGGLGSKYSKEVNGTRVGDGKENWYALNLLDELDRPGEWCLRFSSKTLYVWPTKDLAKAQLIISDTKEALITMRDTESVTIQGMTLEYGLGHGVEVKGGKAVQIKGCVFRNLGGTGAIIDGGFEHRVSSSDFHHLGQGGIYVGGGDQLTLTKAGHEIANNHIHHIGQTQTTYAPAIKLGAYGYYAAGCRVAHNLIHDLPHAAVLYGGNDNLLEGNEIWRVALDSGDVGAFYAYHDWTSRGNVLRHNIVADSPNANAFYMDDGDSGDTVVQNIIWKTHYGPFIGGGHDNIVKENLIIDCPRGIHIDDRGVSRGYNATHKQLAETLRKVKFQQPPWSDRYPEMKNILTFHPDWPTGNVISDNVLIDCPTLLHVSGKKEHMAHSKIGENRKISRTDAGLTKDANPITTLRRNGVVIQGFPALPFKKIGLYKDDFRSTLPQVDAGPMGTTKEVFDSQRDVESGNRK